MLHTNLKAIDETFLAAVVADKTPETQTLDFKREFPPTGPSGFQDLQKDICAFANADGGDLVYGIAEAPRGFASKLFPLDNSSIDRLLTRLSQATAAIEPTPFCQTKKVTVHEGTVLIVRVPASFDGPHSFWIPPARRFVMRIGTDTSDLNLDQLRAAFGRTASLEAQARQFIADRIRAIEDRTAWVQPFAPGPICLALAVPLAGLAGRVTLDIASIALNSQSYRSWDEAGSASVASATNLEGLMLHQVLPSLGGKAFTQVHRNGAFDAAKWVARSDDSKTAVGVAAFFRHAVKTFLEKLRTHHAHGPVVLQLAMLRTRGVALQLVAPLGFPHTSESVERDQLVLPSIIVDAVENARSDQEIDDAIVRPLMDVLWQSFDIPACGEFDASGKFKNP